MKSLMKASFLMVNLKQRATYWRYPTIQSVITEDVFNRIPHTYEFLLNDLYNEQFAVDYDGWEDDEY